MKMFKCYQLVQSLLNLECGTQLIFISIVIFVTSQISYIYYFTVSEIFSIKNDNQYEREHKV